MFKKLYVYLILTVVISSLFLSACSNDASTGSNEDGKDGKVNLKFTMWGGETDQTVYEERLKLAKEKYPDISVELVYIPSEYSQKVQTMIAGKTAPDIMQLAEDVHSYSSKNQLAPLNDYLDASGVNLDENFGVVAENYTSDGNVYALPDRGGSLIVYYNKDMFDEAGIEYPTENWTWDDLLSAAQKLTVRDGDEVTQWGFGAGDWWPMWMSFMYQNGGGVLDDEGNVIINSPESVEAMEFYVDLIHKHKVSPSKTDYANMGDIGSDQLFAQGKLAINFTGFWNIGTASNAEGLNWDIAPLWKNKEAGTVPFGSGLAVSSQSKYKEEAYKIVEFLTSEEGQMPIVENKQDAPSNIKVLSSEEFLTQDWANHPLNVETFEKSANAIIKLPLVPQWNEMQKIFTDNFAGLWSNDNDVKETLDQTQEDLEALLNN